MRKVISFLGKVARDTNYFYKGQIFPGSVFAIAMRQFLEFDEMLIFVTDEAERQAYPVLAALGDARIRAVKIPNGTNGAELWQLFTALVDNVDEGDEVVFDITHGLRSIPFLVFLVASYLRAAKNVQLHKVLYGAFELGVAGKPAPVIELTEFVTLLDWITATNQFIYTGNARYLANLLREQGDVHSAPSLAKAGDVLSDLSLAMMLCRPLEVMQQAGRLGHSLAEAEESLVQWVKPFNLLADRIQNEYGGRALDDPTHENNVRASLCQQLDLIGWYLDKRQVIQAVTLAREWVVTAVGWRLGRGFVLATGERRQIENGLGGIIRLDREQEDGSIFSEDDLSTDGRALCDWPECDDLRRLWSDLTQVRNDLDHAGMSPNAAKSAKLAHKSENKIWPALRRLAAKWGIVGD